MRYLIILFLALCSLKSTGQIGLVFHLNSPSELKGNVRSIEEEWTMGAYSIVYRKVLNGSNQVLVDERFDGKGSRVATYTFKYDSASSLRIEEHREFFEQSAESTVAIQRYLYTKGNLNEILLYNDRKELTGKIRVTNSAEGHPIRLDHYNLNGNLIQSEIAKFDYIKNRADFQILDGVGNLVHSGFFIISYVIESKNPAPGFVYNEKGHLVQTPDSQIEIEYDKSGNWVSMKTYEYNKDKVRTITLAQSRTIHYLE